MHLIHLLVFFAAKHEFWFSASHIPGRQNSRAGAISRNRLDQFFSEVPQAAPSPQGEALFGDGHVLST